MDLTKKLQLRPGQPVLIVDAPPARTTALETLTSTSPGSAESALLVFVLNRLALEEHRNAIVSSATADRLTWVAYPKSGQLGTDLNRDTLAAALTTHGVQPVRQIAIDDVWSALRFRPDA